MMIGMRKEGTTSFYDTAKSQRPARIEAKVQPKLVLRYLAVAAEQALKFVSLITVSFVNIVLGYRVSFLPMDGL